MVIATNVSPWHRRTHLQLYRETTLQLYQSDGGQSVIQSFPASSTIDHNPVRGLVYEDSNMGLTMPPVHPSPAHKLPLQSTQATDHSAILIGNMPRPLRTHLPSAGIYKVRFEQYTGDCLLDILFYSIPYRQRLSVFPLIHLMMIM